MPVTAYPTGNTMLAPVIVWPFGQELGTLYRDIPIDSDAPDYPDIFMPSVEITGEYATMVAEIDEGALPTGVTMMLSADGDNAAWVKFTGTPTIVGTYTFILRITNAHGDDSKQFYVGVGEITDSTSDPVMLGMASGTWAEYTRDNTRAGEKRFFATVSGAYDFRYEGWGETPSPEVYPLLPGMFTGPETVTWDGAPPATLPSKTLFTVRPWGILSTLITGEYNLFFGMYDTDGVKVGTITFWLSIIRYQTAPMVRGNINGGSAY